MDNWRKGGRIGSVYKYVDKEHNHRIGSCDWLPEDGDLCLCVGHSGDCFSSYVAMREVEGGLKKVGKFGAYVFGESLGYLEVRDFHLVQAGEIITLQVRM